MSGTARSRRAMADDAGAGAVGAVAVCTVLALGLLLLGQGARAVVLDQRAKAAADLTALAAAAALLDLAPEPCRTAALIAAGNASQQISCTIRSSPAGPDALVTVRTIDTAWPFGRVAATARAGLRATDSAE